MARSWSVVAVAVLLGVFAAGCNGTTGSSTANGGAPEVILEPETKLQVSDVPVPRDFALVPAQSFASESKGFRLYLLTYEGEAGVEAICRFYKDQMPISNWKLKTTSGTFESMRLDFEKGNEECVVVIERKGRKTVLKVTVK
ncbi:MAG: hypothetical protein V1809_00910 [Planctomycetota bacterium]